MTAPSEQKTPGTLAQRNIETIAKLEHATLGERSFGEKIGRALVRTAGRPRFVVFHLLCFVGWIAWNSSSVGSHRWMFDPYPFAILELVATLEAIFLALLILISQNRLQREGDHRAHLELQINMLTELEGTKIIQMLHGLSKHLNVQGISDDQLDELKAETDPEHLAESIKRTMPAEE